MSINQPEARTGDIKIKHGAIGSIIPFADQGFSREIRVCELDSKPDA